MQHRNGSGSPAGWGSPAACSPMPSAESQLRAVQRMKVLSHAVPLMKGKSGGWSPYHPAAVPGKESHGRENTDRVRKHSGIQHYF